jgi:cytoskeletal protein RodZ
MLKDFGADLRNLREVNGISLAEISAQTRINTKFLTLMESGVFDFQPETYMRAFLKEYARCVAVPENVILTDYEKAKSGFYVKKSGKKEEPSISIKPVMEGAEKPAEIRPVPETKSAPKEKKEGWPEIRKRDEDDSSKEFANKTLTQKILLGLLIVIIILGIIYLIDYLNGSDDDKSSNVKPKSFSEISEDYENKIKGKQEDTTTVKEDTLSTTVNDSLKLTIVTQKDVRIKVYVDEKRTVEDMIPAKDSMIISAKQQFRFSASANASVDLFLNGMHLKKPSGLSGSTSIKNLVINKDGIVSE